MVCSLSINQGRSILASWYLLGLAQSLVPAWWPINDCWIKSNWMRAQVSKCNTTSAWSLPWNSCMYHVYLLSWKTMEFNYLKFLETTQHFYEYIKTVIKAVMEVRVQQVFPLAGLPPAFLPSCISLFLWSLRALECRRPCWCCSWYQTFLQALVQWRDGVFTRPGAALHGC